MKRLALGLAVVFLAGSPVRSTAMDEPVIINDEAVGPTPVSKSFVYYNESDPNNEEILKATEANAVGATPISKSFIYYSESDLNLEQRLKAIEQKLDDLIKKLDSIARQQ